MGLNPVAWRGVSGSVGTIQELSTAELRELAYVVLKQVATSNGCGSMFLSTNTTFQLVGTHEDIFRDSTDPNIVSSTVHEIRQNVNAASISETLPPAFIRTANSEYPLVQANNSLIQTLANNILYYCTFEEGPNSYRISETNPNTTYGGTWTEVGTMSNKNISSDLATTSLWVRTDDGGFTPQRPLKLGDASGTLNQFTNTDISNLAYHVRQRIANTGLATYSFGETAPLTGSWTAVGTVIDSIRTATGDYLINYTTDLTYANEYLGPINYTGTQTFNTNFIGDAPPSFASNFTNPNAGGPFSSNFTNPDAGGPFTSSFINPNGSGFTNPDVNPFTGNFTNPDFNPFSSNFTNPNAGGPFSSNFTNPDAGGPFTSSFINPNGSGFTNPNVNPFTGNFTNPDFNPFSSNFTNPDANSWTTNYLGPTLVNYIGPVTYTIEYSGGDFFQLVSYLAGYINFAGSDDPSGLNNYFSGTYVGDVAANYLGPSSTPITYFGPASYTGDYLGPVTYFGPASFSANYFGPATYTGDFTGPDISYTAPADSTPFATTNFNYIGPVSIYVSDTVIGPSFFAGGFNYYGPWTYLGPGNFFGPATNYARAEFIGSANYVGPKGTFTNPSVTYVGPVQNFSGQITYVGNNGAPFINPDGAGFLDYGTYYGPITPAPDTGETFYGDAYAAPGNYLGPGTYAGPSGNFTSNFINPNATGPFTSNFVNPDFNPFTNANAGGPFTSNFINPDASPFFNTIFNPDGVSYLTSTPTNFGSDITYFKTFYVPIYYVSDYYSTGPTYTAATFYNSYTFDSVPFTGTAEQNYSITYYGPATYTGDYLGPQTFSSTYFGPANYLGPATYTGDYLGLVTYTGEYFGPQTFSSTYFGPATYLGPATYTGDYLGPVAYTGDYLGPVAYTGEYLSSAPYTGDYVGEAPFVGEVSFSFNYLLENVSYTNQYTVDLSNYATQYAANATLSFPSVTSTLSTKYLWRRVG